MISTVNNWWVYLLEHIEEVSFFSKILFCKLCVRAQVCNACTQDGEAGGLNMKPP